jgi:hypothetical protein
MLGKASYVQKFCHKGLSDSFGGDVPPQDDGRGVANTQVSAAMLMVSNVYTYDQDVSKRSVCLLE